MATTKIEWADATWNPITGCTPISEACDHCYAKRMANRLRGRYGYPADDPFRVTFHEDRYEDPEKWKKPRRIFVGSMTDIFHRDVDRSMLDSLFVMMEEWGAHHTYMVLTKRIDRAARYFEGVPKRGKIRRSATWPPNNCWIGITAENQARADERIPILLQIPAAVRFVSVEPMLGPIDFEKIKIGCAHRSLSCSCSGPCSHPTLDWVICGGETGPGARPMHPDWVRSLRDQCVAAGTPFFFKGWGEWRQDGYRTDRFSKNIAIVGSMRMFRPGKKHAGRLLDGREWSEFPG